MHKSFFSLKNFVFFPWTIRAMGRVLGKSKIAIRACRFTAFEHRPELAEGMKKRKIEGMEGKEEREG